MITKKKNPIRRTLLAFAVLIIQISSAAKTPSDLSKGSIIPKPVSITPARGHFALKSGTNIYIQGDSKELKQIGQYLADKLKPSTGFGIAVMTTDKTPGEGSIYLTTTYTNSKLGDEGYELTITKKQVILSANCPAGLFRGVQTIRQLLPAKIEMASKQRGP